MIFKKKKKHIAALVTPFGTLSFLHAVQARREGEILVFLFITILQFTYYLEVMVIKHLVPQCSSL